jgi:hypothetical protein
MGDHRIVLGVRILGDVEILLNLSPRIGFQKFIDPEESGGTFCGARGAGWDRPAPMPCKATPPKPAQLIRISSRCGKTLTLTSRAYRKLHSAVFNAM